MGGNVRGSPLRRTISPAAAAGGAAATHLFFFWPRCCGPWDFYVSVTVVRNCPSSVFWLPARAVAQVATMAPEVTPHPQVPGGSWRYSRGCPEVLRNLVTWLPEK